MSDSTLYQRLGGYDALTAFADDLLPRLQGDPQLGRFWKNRGDDGLAREKQLLVDYLCAKAGGPMYYTGREMKATHVGMGISESDWQVFLGHAGMTMKALGIPAPECEEVVAFVLSLQDDILDTPAPTRETAQ